MAPLANPPRKPSKGDDDPFGDLFANFDQEFRRMQEMMSKIMEDALRNAEIPKGASQPGNPFVYGFTMRVGPDGKPRIEQFGNTPPRVPGLGRGLASPSPEIATEGGREPITDVIEHDDHVSITVELPGVERDDVQVWTTEDQLTLKVDTPARKYHKAVHLPAKVREETTEATFKNGVLDVTVKKRESRDSPPVGHRVNIK